ncbi:MAG: hypothetical protein EU549_00285 [Promethearchaeota archaeon]|nr:MAG: hypothetical protein EU549_00285 [Candidatus Lokiarchaeota archaeon]
MIKNNIEDSELKPNSIFAIQQLNNNSELIPDISNWTHWENESWYDNPVIPNIDSLVWKIENDLLSIDYGNFEMQYENPLLVEGEYNTEKGQWVMEPMFPAYMWKYRVFGSNFSMEYNVKYFGFDERNVSDYNYNWFENHTQVNYTDPELELLDNVSIVSFNVSYANAIRPIFEGEFDTLNGTTYNVSIIFGYHIWYNLTHINIKIDQYIDINFINHTFITNESKFYVVNEYRLIKGDQTIYPSTGGEQEGKVVYEVDNHNISSFEMNPNYSIQWDHGEKTLHNVTRIISTDEEPEGYFITEFKNINWSSKRIIYDPEIELYVGFLFENENTQPIPIKLDMIIISLVLLVSAYLIKKKKKYQINAKKI